MTQLLIEPMACPHSAILTVPYEELSPVIDQAWESTKNSLVKKYDVKFQNPTGPEARKSLESTVGVSKLYSQSLVDFVVKKINADSDKKVLFIHSTPRVSNYVEGQDANLYFVFYFNPEIEYPYTFQGTHLKLDVQETLDEMVSKQLLSMKKVPFGGCLNSKCCFTLEIEALSNGKKDKTEYQSLDEIDIPEFRTILETHKVNDVFNYKLEEDKEVEVKISNVKYRETEELDDVFFQGFGYDDVDKFKDKLKEIYDHQVLNTKKNQVVDHIINTIVTKGKVDPIPAEFVHYHITRIKEEHYNKVGKKETWEKFVVRSEDELNEKLDELVVQDFIQTMAFRCYAKFNGVDSTDIEKIVDHMISQIIWD